MAPDRPGPPGTRLLLCFPALSLARKAVRSGLDPWLLADRAHQRVFTPLAGGRLVLVDPGDEAAVAAAVARVVRERAITHVLDATGFPVAGVPGPESARAPHVLADIGELGRVLARSRHPMVRTRVVAAAGDVPAAAAEIGWPVVVRSECEQTVVWSAPALERWLAAPGRRAPFAVAEFVAGPEVVTTTLTHDGMHRVVGLTARRPGAHGVRYLHPAPLPESAAMAVRAAVTAMLDLVGYEFGPAETTVVLADDGPRIVGSRPCFGTRGIPRLIKTATGFDVQTELFRALAGVPVHPPVPRWFAAVEFFRPFAGRPGDGLPGLRVLAEGATPEAVEARLDAARDSVPPTRNDDCYVRFAGNTVRVEVSGIEDGMDWEQRL
ncbi:ATP-grasp domain-containing protein [Amycolatopsis rifamycinica]|uniref:ATP-grasp domain-containing protein n=1 Tax=Amycolatopsis rifamycinica TaxID=287986 RepID=A0A066UC79_9PSEU|nr:hypothetical protein [Amycolatopsis rifamycinica]KDN21719.1 hypothetical protein DV20_12350 [Amycolatopsis rifamycinica]